MIESYSIYRFESKNNNFQSKKLISGGVICLRRTYCRATLWKCPRQYLKTVNMIDLKIAQWDSEPKITPYTKFNRNWEVGCYPNVNARSICPGTPQDCRARVTRGWLGVVGLLWLGLFILLYLRAFPTNSRWIFSTFLNIKSTHPD